MKTQNLTLVLPQEQTLKVSANLGDTDYPFLLILPHWPFAKKLAVGKEFRGLGKELGDTLNSKLEEAKLSSAVGQKALEEFQEALEAPTNYEGLKAFIMKYVVAFDGLTINVINESTGEKEVLNLIRRDHEFFPIIVDQLWSYEGTIVAIRDRLAKFFER